MDLSSPWPFPQQAVPLTQSHLVSLLLVQDCVRIFSHANHWQVLAQCDQNDRKTEQAVKQDIVRSNSSTDCTFDHCLKVVCIFCHGFKPFFIAEISFIHFLVNLLKHFFPHWWENKEQNSRARICFRHSNQGSAV